MKWGLFLFISLFFGVGFALLGSGLFSYYKGQKSLKWPETDGVIIDCKLEENYDSDGSTWRVQVRYSYDVSGQKFEGDRVSFGYLGSNTYEQHSSIYQKLNNASVVRVKYSPKNPSESVLAAGFNRSNLFILVFAITWLLFMTGFTILILSSSGRDPHILEQIKVVE